MNQKKALMYRLVNSAGDQIGPNYETLDQAIEARLGYKKYRRNGDSCTYRIQSAELVAHWTDVKEVNK